MRIEVHDLRSSVVVFLVALPLCLGVALASNAPLAAGLVAGIIGGIVIGPLGGSSISVSGPAAGLTVIVAGSIAELQSFPAFGAALFLAGLMQLVMGVLKAGELANFFPTSVIRGMLAAIGLILIIKQLPSALGYQNGSVRYGVLIISLISLSTMLLWDRVIQKHLPHLKLFPSALVAVLLGMALHFALKDSSLALSAVDLVQLPFTGGVEGLTTFFSPPDFKVLTTAVAWKVALTLAVVATLETLLSLDAADKLDPYKRISEKSKEVRAQGIGNTLSGLIGGLPMTAVIVRTTANVSSGATSRTSTIFHGIWLIMAVTLIPGLLNQIPLASLSSVLLLLGWKLTAPKFYYDFWKQGMNQFLPYIVTIAAIVATNLLLGILIGLVLSIVVLARGSSNDNIDEQSDDKRTVIHLKSKISFLQKYKLRKILQNVPEGQSLTFDGTKIQTVDQDILDVIGDFTKEAHSKGITVQVVGGFVQTPSR